MATVNATISLSSASGDLTTDTLSLSNKGQPKQHADTESHAANTHSHYKSTSWWNMDFQTCCFQFAASPIFVENLYKINDVG